MKKPKWFPENLSDPLPCDLYGQEMHFQSRMGGYADAHPDQTIVPIRGNTHISYVFVRYDLHPYSLPYPALGSIEHTAAFQLLFASGMIGGVTEVMDTYEDRDCEIFCDKVCNICGKWKVAALVIADELPLMYTLADLIYSSKMQKKPLTFCIQAVLWQLDGTGIP